ncbi:MAG: U32 family peptidase [Candidatus Scatosoma sp.]
MKTQRNQLEILSPAGNAECARAALNAGADALYLGYGRFSARAAAENFSGGEMKSVIDEAHLFGAKVYVAMNTLVKDDETEDFIRTLCAVWGMGADAVILQDLFLGKAIKKAYPQIVLHLSTQAGVCNANGASLAKEYGFSRVILARETPIKEIEKIAEIIETEAFVQGALCTCFSGQCYFSSFAGGNSGNRGRCKQPCRKKYVYNRTEKAGTNAANAEKTYALSLSDLCVGEDVFTLAEIGVKSFKIEGRMRSKEYVAAATEYYDALLRGAEDVKLQTAFSDLKRAYNRGNYTKGLAFGQDKRLLSPYVQGHIGEKAGVVKVINGKYFVESRFSFRKGDAFKILRDKSEVGGAAFLSSAPRGFYVSSAVRLKNGDGVFVTTDTASDARVLSVKKTIPLPLEIAINKEEYGVAKSGTLCVTSAEKAQTATGDGLTEEDIKECFKKTDGLPFSPKFVSVQTDGAFMPKSKLNAFRRSFYEAAVRERTETANEEPSAESFLRTASPNAANAKGTQGAAGKIAVIARRFTGAETGVDIAIAKPQNYAELKQTPQIAAELFGAFTGGKYLYYPAYAVSETEEAIAAAIRFSGGEYGVYGENYAAVAFARKLGCKLFLGGGANVTNAVAAREISGVSALTGYVLSKETDSARQRKIADATAAQAFVLCAGGVKVMDLCYCPFNKTCGVCDRRGFYTLTDENSRVFPVRRYPDGTGECRFEIYNCADLVSGGVSGAGKLLDFTGKEELLPRAAALAASAEEQKRVFLKYTSGHTKNDVI